MFSGICPKTFGTPAISPCSCLCMTRKLARECFSQPNIAPNLTLTFQYHSLNINQWSYFSCLPKQIFWYICFYNEFISCMDHLRTVEHEKYRQRKSKGKANLFVFFKGITFVHMWPWLKEKPASFWPKIKQWEVNSA